MPIRYNILYKIIIFLSILVLFLPTLSFSFEQSETSEEAKSLGRRFLDSFSNALKKVWQTIWQFLIKLWQTIRNWLKNIWNKYIWPKLEWLGEKISSFFKKKTEEGKETVEKKIEEEKESLWQRFKNLIK
jgi:hypothetical protein